MVRFDVGEVNTLERSPGPPREWLRHLPLSKALVTRKRKSVLRRQRMMKE